MEVFFLKQRLMVEYGLTLKQCPLSSSCRRLSIFQCKYPVQPGNEIKSPNFSPSFVQDIVELQNCLLSHSFLNGKLPSSFETFFQRCSDVHNAPTRFSKSECFYMPRVKSVKYGMNSITSACIHSWNTTTKILESPSSLSLSEVKKYMSNHYINSY